MTQNPNPPDSRESVRPTMWVELPDPPSVSHLKDEELIRLTTDQIRWVRGRVYLQSMLNEWALLNELVNRLEPDRDQLQKNADEIQKKIDVIEDAEQIVPQEIAQEMAKAEVALDEVEKLISNAENSMTLLNEAISAAYDALPEDAD